MVNFTAVQIIHIASLQCHIKRSVKDAQGGGNAHMQKKLEANQKCAIIPTRRGGPAI